MDDCNKIIGANIRYERQLRDFTIETVADMVGMTPGFWGLIERGQRGTSMSNLCKIADLFSISLDTLIKRDIQGFTESDKMNPIERKNAALESLLSSLSSSELDFVIEVVKQLIALRNKEFAYDY